MRNRSSVLELAVLGLLHSAPMHGYQLRKRLNEMLGMLRPFSYGSLYPCLKALAGLGLIATSEEEAGMAARRGRIVYRLTAQGRQHLEALLGQAGPATWEDENFDVRFAMFAQTDAETRLRILEGRRARMAERLDAVSSAIRRAGPADQYTQELQRHILEQVEREVNWLEELIARERGLSGASATSAAAAAELVRSAALTPARAVLAAARQTAKTTTAIKEQS
ncbi:MAG: PadR family transcriptional regulator [Bifidobacteriaceae bacterium]|nr:PadR family transcriptional regulator [Bifidobacteriaceae bacterium]